MARITVPSHIVITSYKRQTANIFSCNYIIKVFKRAIFAHLDSDMRLQDELYEALQSMIYGAMAPTT